MYYNHVTVSWKTIVDKSTEKLEKTDVFVIRYGIHENEALSYKEKQVNIMKEILKSHPDAIPRIISSIASGININQAPYWNGVEKAIIQEIKNRFQRLGIENIMLCDHPITQKSKNKM